jgi:HSP20 family protein
MPIRKEKKNKIIERPTKRHDITARKPYDIWRDMDSLFDSFRTNFDDLFWPWSGSSGLTTYLQDRTPPMNVADMGDHYEMRLEVPGIPKDNIDITVKQNGIEIKAECNETKEEKGKNWLRHECSGTSFYRTIELPEDLKTDDVDAELKDGVLRVSLPKLEPKPVQKSKKIKIR